MKKRWIPSSVPVHIAARQLSKHPDELSRRLGERQIVTVRCAFCAWELTGPALLTSVRGNEIGVLARQKKHAQQHVRRREYKREWRRRQRQAAA